MLYVTDVAFLMICFCILKFRDSLNMSIPAPPTVMIAGKIKNIVIPVFGGVVLGVMVIVCINMYKTFTAIWYTI